VLPSWLKTQPIKHAPAKKMRALLAKFSLATVCESAKCPNRGSCFANGTVTFLLLGDRCTRNCGFCAIKHGTSLPQPDPNTALEISEAVKILQLNYLVLTSVTRDDLPDGGASVFAETILLLQKNFPHLKVEVLTPDFCEDQKALDLILKSNPQVFNHNIETVPRLYPEVRNQADYQRSLALLKYLKNSKFTPIDLKTKSGFMVGLGESFQEIEATLVDLKKAEVDIVTIGQYLRPSPAQVPVVAYITPAQFAAYAHLGASLGLKVYSSPLVRSSYQAHEAYLAINAIHTTS
jgi:lipoic acid synthetase